MQLWITTLCLLLGTYWPTGQTQIQAYLQEHGASATRAAQVAAVIVQQSAKWRVDPALVTAIVTVENPELRSQARSLMGAQGVMQIMPGWKRRFHAICGTNLHNDHVNVCYGIHVWKDALRDHPSPVRALLAYNGCRSRGTCRYYPRVVLTRYGRLQQNIRDSQPKVFALLDIP